MTDQTGEPNVRAYLVTVTEVTALLGQRIYSQRAPDGSRGLYAVYQRSGRQGESTFCAPDDLVGGDYQIDVYGRDDQEVGLAARAIRRAMVETRVAQMGPVAVKKVFLVNDFDSVDPDPGLVRRTQLYTIWYAEG